MKMNKEIIQQSKRIVIKIGSALLTDEKSGEVRQNWLNTLAQDIQALGDKEIVIVSSGAIALGRMTMGIGWTNAPSSIPLEKKQAAASIGQVTLAQAYQKSFKAIDRQTGLILLTPRDTENRRSHLNARATISALLEQKIIPVINENDTVSTSEIRFGDNDRLSARVAQMIGADLLILLSTTDGLYTANPDTDKNARHIPLVEELSEDVLKMAGDAPKGLSTGGMKSKLDAARIAMSAGIHMIIAKGLQDSPLEDMPRSTLFKAIDTPASARKKWIQAHVKPAGAYILDDGAVAALVTGKSLLPAGVVKVTGNFERGDAVNLQDAEGKFLGIGLTSYSSQEANIIAGKKSSEIADFLGYSRGDTLIHRDDLALQA